MNRCIALVLVGLTALVSLDPVAAVEVPRENEIVKLVYFADGRPILIELYPRLDGRSFRDVYRDFSDKLFDYLDRDKDGVLSKSEAAGAPSPSALAGPNAFFGGRGGTPAKIGSGDGNVTREQLAAYYKRGGLAPFGISFAPRETGVIDVSSLNQNRNTSAEAINNRLFQLLDTDKDGKLSRKELEACPAILAKLDADEDEMLTTAELQGQGGIRSDDAGGLFVFEAEGGTSPTGNQPFHLVSENASDAPLAKRLLQRYGKKGDTGLSAKQFGVDKQVFEWLDLNEDGVLDVRELARFGQLHGDARFTVRLGKRDEKQSIVSVEKSNRHVAAQAKDDGVELTMGNVRLVLAGPKAASSNVFVNFNVRDQYITQFRMADTDSNGYLDKAEGEKAPFFRNTFVQMDRDGDGMLYEKEMLAYVDGIEEMRKLANKSCLTVTVMDAGKGVFEMIDRDGDGRLCVRELRQMTQLLDKLDENRDGSLARSEVPRRYKGTFDLGASTSGPSGARAIVFRSDGSGPAAAPAKSKGPVWFRKMDRNRDGDVSRKEWLGTEDEYRAIDRDGDGLISLDEAERYDMMKRVKSE